MLCGDQLKTADKG